MSPYQIVNSRSFLFHELNRCCSRVSRLLFCYPKNVCKVTNFFSLYQIFFIDTSQIATPLHKGPRLLLSNLQEHLHRLRNLYIIYMYRTGVFKFFLVRTRPIPFILRKFALCNKNDIISQHVENQYIKNNNSVCANVSSFVGHCPASEMERLVQYNKV